MSLHLKNYSNRTFLCWKTNISVFYSLKGKNHKFVRINLLVELFFCFYVCFFETKNIYSHTHSTNVCRVGEKTFPLDRLLETRLSFFFGLKILYFFAWRSIFDVWQSSKYTLLNCLSKLRLTLGSFCSTIIIIAIQCSEHIKKGLRLKVEVAEASIQSCSGKWVFCNFRQNPLTIDD